MAYSETDIHIRDKRERWSK